MKLLSKYETRIAGKILIQLGMAMFDGNAQRIRFLTKNVLKWLAEDNSGWYTLYFDDQHGNYWEKWYPQSESHSGGAPELRKITDLSRIKEVYSLDV